MIGQEQMGHSNKRAPREESERTCVGHPEGGALPAAGLVRFVAIPAELGELALPASGKIGPGEFGVALDLGARAPGRGAWLCADPACVERAVKKGGFSRAFRATVRTPTAPVLMEAMVEALRRSIVQRLALARRAGALEIGAENVAAALKQGRGSLLILASDLSEGGRRKQEVNANRKELPVVGPVDGAALGGALGRDHAGVILVCAEPFAQDLYRLSLQVDTLSGYNTARPEPRG